MRVCRAARGVIHGVRQYGQTSGTGDGRTVREGLVTMNTRVVNKEFQGPAEGPANDRPLAGLESYQEIVARLEEIQVEIRQLVEEALIHIEDSQRPAASTSPAPDAPRAGAAMNLEGRRPPPRKPTADAVTAAMEMDREASEAVRRQCHSLTCREREVVRLLAMGLTSKAIADVLQISHATARNHIQHIYEKLNVHSRAELISFAYRNSLSAVVADARPGTGGPRHRGR